MKVYLHNFGCKVNAIETDGIAALLREKGWETVKTPETADALILNSCTVTASGDKRMLHMLKKLRRTCPEAVILLTGCYVQAFPEEAAALSDADLLVTSAEHTRIPELLEQFRNGERLRRIPEAIPERSFRSLPLGSDAAHTRAFLKIQDGCDRFCSYCIIPYARGRSCSRSMKSLVESAAELAGCGYQEIVLCGINLACYGAEEGYTIADAADVCRRAGFRRVRLGSLEPDGLTDEILEQLVENPAFCPQFHISLQSGCDRTLKAMHRQYTCGEYAALVETIRNLFPDCAVTTDMMTGFPGETDADFAQTLAFAEKMAFSKIHVFRYSRRPGTLADRMEAQIPESVKKQRADRLSALEKQMHNAFLKSRIGNAASVLFEREKTAAFHIGHTPDYSRVLVPAAEGEGSFRNRICRVRITDIAGEDLIGELCEQIPQDTLCSQPECDSRDIFPGVES